MTQVLQLSEGIRLYSGVMFDYNDPDACDVQIEDIAHALSNICRFSGHCRHFYSVAQHAVLASCIAPHGFEYDALMHDTAEAFTNDLPRPLKVQIPGFKKLEQDIEGAMGRRFGFNYPLSPEIIRVDNMMLSLEKDALMTDDTTWACLGGVEEDARKIAHLVDMSSWSAHRAKLEFLQRYEELRP